MSNDSPRTGRVRWRWILPTLAFELTFLLELTGIHERRPSGMGYTSTAWGIEAILNYPAVVVDSLLRFVDRITYSLPDVVGTAVAHATRFGCVVLFWLWIGWTIDTRKHRKEGFTTTRHFVWASCVYLIVVAFCIAEVWISWRSFDVMAFSLVHENTHPLNIWVFDSAVGAIWFLAGAVYFGNKALSLWKSRSIHTQRA